MDWMDWVLYGCVGLLGLVILFLVFLGLDWLSGHTASNIGTVRRVDFEPRHTQMMMVGKVLVPRFIPDTWLLQIETPDGWGCFSLREPPEYWNGIGQRITATYRIGGFTKSVSISEIRSQ